MLKIAIAFNLGIFVSFALVVPETASANQTLTVSYPSQPNAPIAFECAGALYDSDVGNTNYYLKLVFGLINNTENPMQAVEFEVDILDGFNDVLGTRTAELDGYYSPHVKILPKTNVMGVVLPQFSAINIWPSATAVRCSVRRVRYEDGTIWSADVTPQAAPPTVAAAPSATPAPSPPPPPQTAPQVLDRKPCNRAWLAADWATTAVECTSLASSAESQAKDLESGGASANAASESLNAAGEIYLLAGKARACAAVAFAKLNRSSIAHQNRHSALSDLESAASLLENPDDRRLAQALSRALKGTFPQEVQQSDSLATL